MNKQSPVLLAIVIAMFNEEVEAKRCVQTVLQYCKTIPAIQLIVINDGSTDGTRKILEHCRKETHNAFRVVTHHTNLGYGAALRTGVTEAREIRAAYTLFMDADLTNHPRYIKDFVKVIPLKYDCVKASRFIDGGKMIGVPLYRQMISYCGNLFARLCFRLPIHDYTNGFRMIKTDILVQIPYTMNDFSVLLEEMYWLKKLHARLTEIPTILTSRVVSTSHFFYRKELLLQYLTFALKSIRI
ncbi:glycosyltransferase family 2 protein [Candidatus Woesebacteria bacterium]|nr:glycosyltransferase family 2 protein [Candidatus Woesebacteria bacterium]